MNQAIAAQYSAANGFFLPAGGAYGIKLDALSAIGITVLDEATKFGFRRCSLPEGWTPVPADVSPMQLRLHDDQNRLRAKLFYKPGSQGGCADMQIWTRFNVAIATDETHLWAEVYDGNELIHATAKALKSDRNLDSFGFNAHKQFEHIQATTWLTERFPNHADPLAYWN